MHCLEVKNRDIEMKNKAPPLNSNPNVQGVHELMGKGVLTQLFAQKRGLARFGVVEKLHQIDA